MAVFLAVPVSCHFANRAIIHLLCESESPLLLRSELSSDHSGFENSVFYQVRVTGLAASFASHREEGFEWNSRRNTNSLSWSVFGVTLAILGM